jgi:hypothetical protein
MNNGRSGCSQTILKTRRAGTCCNARWAIQLTDQSRASRPATALPDTDSGAPRLGAATRAGMKKAARRPPFAWTPIAFDQAKLASANSQFASELR